MSETETTVPMDDKALFDSAISDAVPAETVTTETTEKAAPEAAEQPTDGPVRDEHGRFAAKDKPAEAEKPDAQQQPQETAHVPAWRLNEVSEARRAAEARAVENERRAHDAEMAARRYEAQLRQLTEKPAEPVDPYVDPEKFRDIGVRQAIDPVMQRVSMIGETFSRKLAIAQHGLETVQEAYKWLDEASRAADPRAGQILQRAMNSIDPFEDIVSAFKEHRAISTVGPDPEKWFNAQLAERAKDPAKRQELAAVLGQPQQQNGNGAQQQGNTVVRLPPSLTRQPGTSGNAEAGSMADADLYAHATR